MGNADAIKFAEALPEFNQEIIVTHGIDYFDPITVETRCRFFLKDPKNKSTVYFLDEENKITAGNCDLERGMGLSLIGIPQFKGPVVSWRPYRGYK